MQIAELAACWQFGLFAWPRNQSGLSNVDGCRFAVLAAMAQRQGEMIVACAKAALGASNTLSAFARLVEPAPLFSEFF